MTLLPSLHNMTKATILIMSGELKVWEIGSLLLSHCFFVEETVQPLAWCPEWCSALEESRISFAAGCTEEVYNFFFVSDYSPYFTYAIPLF